jgi:hypothetical protein
MTAQGQSLSLHDAIITHYFNAYGTGEQKRHWLASGLTQVSAAVPVS